MKQKKPMLKFNRIGKTAALKIVGKGNEAKTNASLKRIYPKTKPKFFKIRGIQVLAVGTTQIVNPVCFETMISKYSPEKELFKKFARCRFKNTNEGLTILTAGKILKHGKIDLSKQQKTGFNIFRLFLNEAIAKGKALGAKQILIYTANAELKQYYESLGFEPGKPYYKFKLK